MKCTLFLLLICSGFYSTAQQNGYYVTLENDTVPAVIKIKKDVFGPYSFYSLYKNVKIADSAKGERVFQPGEINSFYVET